MPSATPITSHITKFTNCRLLKGDQLVEQDLWVSSASGKIVRSQEAFYDQHAVPNTIVDLGGRILCPGFIEAQINGAFGFDFSVVPDDVTSYGKTLKRVNKELIRTGVTSYLPTVVSQYREVYHKVLPFLGPSGAGRRADDGSEVLGAHCEGPFISPTKNGCHKADNLRAATRFEDLEDCYGSSNLQSSEDGRPPNVKVITAAPEVGSMIDLIPAITSRGITYSIGHSEATYEEASAAVANGATMITHLFNAMRPLHHRNPGIFGVLGIAESQPRPYFGIIADGIHLHPTSIKIAFNAHPDGFILVTDAMHLLGMPDGVHDWTNGQRIVKRGTRLTLNDTDIIAGSVATLIDCISNFLTWSGASIPQALNAVTATPAAMLGLKGVKGSLESDADADLVVLSEETQDGATRLVVDQVWKFGVMVYERK